MYRGAPIRYVYTLDITVEGSEQALLRHSRKNGKNCIVSLAPSEQAPIDWRAFSPHRVETRPAVVGFGPAGIFAAWALAKAGYNPLVLERGPDVDTRSAAVENFWQRGIFSPGANAQFGEGGAGTFSDGKLTYRGDDSLAAVVAEEFVESGAPEEIRYVNKPHIGTDRLKVVVKNLRRKIVSLGGEVRFGAQVTDLEIKEGKITAFRINESDRIPVSAVFLSIGHSARDTYRMLHRRGVCMEAKPFAVGVRIEHPQELIDRAQYKAAANTGRLPPADYRLSWRDKTTGRSAYSFCMCPGGRVVAATSDAGRVVTNGMSVYARDSGRANAALAVNVNPADWGGDALGGIAWQEKYEGAAFVAGGGNYYAPVQSVGDFLAGRTGSKDFLLAPGYNPGVTVADLREVLPPPVTATLLNALPQFDRKINGFAAPDVPLTGIETRTSAPCRIVRENYQSVNVRGLYPIGEGAGYAGGIMSAAIDGLRAVISFLQKN